MNIPPGDMDPLSSYHYQYPSYSNIPHPPQYGYNVKPEPPIENYQYRNNLYQVPNQNIPHNTTNDWQNHPAHIPNNKDSNVINTESRKETEDIKPVIDKKIKKEKKGRTSSYWSVKITDADFAFYGCAVCNIKFKTLNELDQHVATHKDRITSYDLRIKNQIKRKAKLKAKKSDKKLKKKYKKIKPESLIPDIEIKPEDGYIGNERTADYDQSGKMNKNNLQNNCEHKDKEVSQCNETENKVNETERKVKEMKKKMNEMELKVNGEENEFNSQDPEKIKKLYNLEKIYKCFACQKQFSLSYYLKLHVRSHTNEKPYVCSICGQSFITASHLGRHNKRIHLAVRHQCRICYKFFSKFDLLTRHFDKKHPDDKLEGEPYDYNAILPYLKELEEEIRQKSENGDANPKSEDLFSDVVPPKEDAVAKVEEMNVVSCTEEPKVEDYWSGGEEPVELNFNHVDIVALPVEEEEPKIKLEVDDQVDERDHDSFGKCSDSEEDYFPVNTWASQPDPQDVPASPPRTRRSRADGPLQCEVCNKSISSSTYLRVHMRTHTGEKPFKCYICSRGFITSSKMHRHVLTHAESWDGKDGIKTEEIDTLEEGHDKIDNKKKKIKKAKSKFSKKPKKGDKQKTRPHACEYCHKRFLHVETLQVHKRSHEGEDLSPKCNFCLEPCFDRESLLQHEATHTGPKPYLCTQCGKTYKKRETMIYHSKSHNSDKEYVCDLCSKRFTAACKLQRHIVSHRANKFVVRYECPVCAHMFHTKYHVQLHLATHLREGLIMEENRNEILAMVLQNARKIPKHPEAGANLTDAIPSDERSRVCNICGEVFQHFYYLEEHLKTHGSKFAIEDLNKVEEKKYVCQVCNKSFKLHYYLKLHSFTHTKEKPFVCQQCGKGFITRGKLKRHLETHSGLKKYQCHICYKFFTRPSYLRIHVRTIHGTQDYNFRMSKEYLASISMSDGSQNSL